MVLFVLGIPICAIAALVVALGTRRRVADLDRYWRKRMQELTRRPEEIESPGTEVPAPTPAPEPLPAPACAEPQPAREVGAPGPSLEARIGGRWFNWVGMLAIVFGVAALWATYGAALSWGGSRRATGLVLVAAALTLALALLAWVSPVPRLLLNSRTLGFGATAAGLLLTSKRHPRQHRLAAGLALAGHAAVMLLLTLEAADYFRHAGAERHARQLSYSLIWAAYAIGLVVNGLLRRDRPVRLMALGVLGTTILKVFILDLSFLENPYRILSFLALGGVLVAVSYLYQRYRHALV